MPLNNNFRRLVASSKSHRSSILRNLVSSLIIHESITTTLAKAKAVQPFAERIITRGKNYTGKRDQRERIAGYFYDWKVTMPKLFDDIAARYRNRPGGYTRIHKLPPRYGDMAPMAILELVDGKRDMLWSMTARRVARSAMLGTKWLSESTRDAMYRVFQFRGPDAVKQFDEEVERQKKLLLSDDRKLNRDRKAIEERTVKDIQDRVDERLRYTLSRHDKRGMRELVEKTRNKEWEDSRPTQEEMDEEVKKYKGQTTLKQKPTYG